MIHIKPADRKPPVRGMSENLLLLELQVSQITALARGLAIAMGGIPIASASELPDPEGEIHLTDPIEIVVGGLDNPLENPAFRARLAELGGGDPAMGFRDAAILIGVTVAEEGAEPVYSSELVLPAVVHHDLPPPVEADEGGVPWLA